MNSPSGGSISFFSRTYIDYRTDFALYWLPHILMRTLMIPMVEEVVDGGVDEEGWEKGSEKYESHVLVLDKWASFGPVPIIKPEELNLHHRRENL